MSPFEIFVRIFFLHFSWQPDESFQTNRKENSIHLRCKLVPEWKQRSALLCKLYFHPAKFDNFKDEKIQSTYVVSLQPNEKREVLLFEVSLNLNVETLFSFCKVWQL